VTAGASDALLRAAAARARSTLLTLDVSALLGTITTPGLFAVVAANGATLRELRTSWVGLGDVLMLCVAAPQLAVLDVCTSCGPREALALLHGEPPFDVPALRVREVLIEGHAPSAEHIQVMALMRGAAAAFSGLQSHLPRVAAAVAAHPWLTSLQLCEVPLNVPGGDLDVLVDAALARPLASLSLQHCGLLADAAPALARLLRGSRALTELGVSNRQMPLLPDECSAATLADALRANTTLTSLTLHAVMLWCHAAAVQGHPSIELLSLEYNTLYADCTHEAAAALAALVAANAPALRTLSLADNDAVGAEEVLGPLFDALRANTHLRTLCYDHDPQHLSQEFVRGVLLPALRANTGLTRLAPVCTTLFSPDAGAEEAEAIVKSRSAASS
jgi:hypothetical protein